MKLSIEDQIIKAKFGATKPAPYLARAIWACQWIPCDDVPTAGIDKNWRVHYNPKYIEKCAKEGTLVGEVLHEVLHPLKRNPSRGEALKRNIGQCDHGRWNCACDAENDQNIENMRSVLLVKDRITPDMLGGGPGQVAEELYKFSKEHNSSTKEGRCSGGSGVTGKAASWEKTAQANAEKAGKMGLSDVQGQLLQMQVASDIQTANDKRPGSVPGGLLRWAKEILAGPTIPWAELAISQIAYTVERKRGTVSSFDRPSRRSSTLILPVHRAAIPNITIVCDTSGSMGETDMGKVLGTVVEACAALGKVCVVACDSAPQEPVEITSLEELQDFLKGGGGTDMPAGIKAAEETNPDAIVVVSDGYTDWPDEETSVPVVCIKTQASSAMPPAWIETILADEAA